MSILMDAASVCALDTGSMGDTMRLSHRGNVAAQQVKSSLAVIIAHVTSGPDPHNVLEAASRQFGQK
jgi:hypothetical protein